MSTSGGDGKPFQTGLVDMGDIAFYNNPSQAVLFSSLLNSDLDPFPGLFSEIVLNVTWAQLQPTQDGQIDPSSLILDAVQAVQAYNQQYDTNLGIKLRVWGGFTAPGWVKNISGPPITVTDKDGNLQTVGRFWTADYIDAWTSFQNQLATAWDSQPLIRGISNTAGASETDEPFISLSSSDIALLQANGYTDAAQQLTLRAAIADYSQWSTTPLDYTMNLFHLYDSGHTNPDENFTLAVLQQARNSAHVVQAGNHALNSTWPSGDAFIYYQMQADATLDPAIVPGSFQTASPKVLDSYANWPGTVAAGVAANAGDIELWDGAPGAVPFPGFPGLSSGQVQALATILAAGTAPTMGAPADGSALGFIAPAFVTGAPGTVSFSGIDAVLLASTATQSAYTVTLTSTKGGTLGVTDPFGIVNGSTSGQTITLSGSPQQVNTVLASLTDTLQSGRDIVQISALDSSGNTAVRSVGVEISAKAVSSGASLPAEVTGPSIVDITDQLAGIGVVFVGGVQNAQTITGDLEIGPDTTLLAALAPSAYSTASLTVDGALEVLSGGTARFSGALGGSTVQIDSGGAVRGNGTLSASGGGAIVNEGTIEVVADLTLGLQQLTVANALAGNGTVNVDAGATLILSDAVSASQTIAFAPPSNVPFLPSTLEFDPRHGMDATITGFSYADRLVLDGVTATGAGYDSGTGILTITLQGVPTATYNLTGTLTGLSPVVSDGNTITFVAPPGGMAPSVNPPPTLQGAVDKDVIVPGIVLQMPLPDNPIFPIGVPEITVTLTTTAGTGGRLSAVDVADSVTITGNNSTTLTLAGTLFAVEQSLQTLTYKGRTDGTAIDSISISATTYAGLSSTAATISVSNYASNAASPQFEWNTTVASGSFDDSTNWTVTGPSNNTPPGGTNVALFKAGSVGPYTVSGNAAVDQVKVTAITTLTGQVIAQGSSGVALVVDGAGALMLAGGAQLSAQAEAIVGVTGEGLLTLMGGSLALTGLSTDDALVIGGAADSDGTVVNLEQITANGTVVVGQSGSGTLALLGVASSMTAGAATIGRSAGAHGTALVNGGFWAIGQSTPEVTSSGQLIVGDSGSGSLLIDGAANGITGQVTAFDATIGKQAGSEGSVVLDGGLLLVANTNTMGSSTLAVGDSGTGSLAIENFSEVALGAASAAGADNGLLIVGRAADGRGRIRIGDYSALLVYGDAHVGEAGVGAVTVGAGTEHDALLAVSGTLSLGSAGQVTLGGLDATVRAEAFHVAAGGGVSGSGTLSGLGAGHGTVAFADIHNDGSIVANGDLLLYGIVTGTGELSMTAGSSITLQTAVGTGQTLAFGVNGHALLNDPHAFAGTIVDFNGDDVLELASTHASSATWADGVLTLDTDLGPLRLKLAGNYATDGFTVESDGLGGTNVAGGRGDVHMMTFDGLRYDFQAVGEFVAVRWTDPGTPLQIQIETAGVHGVASITTELAAAFGNTVVTFAVGRPISLHVDGAPDTALRVSGMQAVPDGTLTQLSSNTYQLTWTTGQAIIVSYHGDWLDWGVALAPQDGPGSVQGLLGTHSGQGTEFQLPDGTVLPHPLSNEEIVGRFADAWRVDNDMHPPASYHTHHDAIL